jgi:hypothetical protein
MNHGKKIRIRRRAAALAGSVAVIAGAIACVPALTHHQALPAPANSHVRVTVNPPGPHSPAGTIASGLIGTKPWDIRIESPGTKQCVIIGPDLSQSACSDGLPQVDAADPIGFNGMGDGNGGNQYFVSYGVVRKDVTSVRVLLADGTVLTSRPTRVYGTRWVAFATPLSVRVDSLTVYSRAGEIATSIPFNGPSGDSEPTFSAWLRPGQAVPGLVSGTIGSGTADGHAWRVTAYLGPWGTCIEGGGARYCVGSTKALGTHLRGGAPGGGASAWWGSAADSVSHVVITLKDGATTRVAMTAVGQQKFWAFYLSKQAQRGDHWTAYDAAGKIVASGPIP